MILEASILEWKPDPLRVCLVPLSLESQYLGCEGGEPAILEMHSRFRFLWSRPQPTCTTLHSKGISEPICKIYNPFEGPLVQSRYGMIWGGLPGPRWVSVPSFSHDPSSKHFTLLIKHMNFLGWSVGLTWQAICQSAVCVVGPESLETT